MDIIAKNEDIKSIIVEVSQEIIQKNILNFAHTSLDLNDINHSNSDIIYCNYLKYSKQYQIFVFPENFTYMIFELLHTKDDLNEDEEIKDIFTLYTTKDFFVIFNANILYTYQKINQEYSINELLEYISKSFKVTISRIIDVDETILEKVLQKNEFKNDILFFKNINQKTNKAFYFYTFYLLISVLGTFFYINYKKETFNQQQIQKVKEDKKEYLKTLKLLKFKSYEKEYALLIQTIKKLDLKLISYKYTSSIMNIKISAKKKSNIYLFLNHYKKSLLSNSISKSDSKNIFISVLNVKITK